MSERDKLREIVTRHLAAIHAESAWPVNTRPPVTEIVARHLTMSVHEAARLRAPVDPPERVSEASALREAFAAGVEVGVAYADKHPSDTHTMPSVEWCHARYEKWAARRALEDTKGET